MSNEWILDQSINHRPIRASSSKPKLALAIGLALMLNTLASAQTATAEEPQNRQPSSAALQNVSDFIKLALSSNQNLRAAEFDVASSLQALDATRAAHWPKLSLQARYSRNEGGRELNFPIGDALNPVYRTLNQLTTNSSNPTNFPSISNVDIALLRERDQDTRLNLTAPIFAPAIDAAVRQAAAGADSSTANREVLARTLVRDVTAAYYNYGLASSAVRIYQASEIVLQENVRVNEALLNSGTVTRDQPLRAQAELLAIQDQLLSAQNRQLAAGRYLNFLTNRDLNAPLPVDVRAQPANDVGNDEGRRAIARPELKLIQAGLAQSDAQAASARADRLPTLGLSVDTGIQGTDYGFGSGRNFTSVNLVLNWRLFDNSQSRRAQQAASLKADALRAKYQATEQQLELAATAADDDVRSAKARAQTAQARLAAAEESFRISERKRDAGSITQIQFLDAERALTEARLAETNAKFDIAIRMAEREFAYASYALPAELLADSNPSSIKASE